MAHYTSATNSSFAASYDFKQLANGEIPQFEQGYPRVSLVDELGRTLLTLVAAMSGEDHGVYTVNVPVPDIPLAERTFYTLLWTGLTKAGSSLNVSEPVLIEPNASLDYDDVIVFGDEANVEFNIPVIPDDKSVRIDLYKANELILSVVPEGETASLPLFKPPVGSKNARTPLGSGQSVSQDYYAAMVARSSGAPTGAYVPAGRDATPPQVVTRSYDMSTIVTLKLPVFETLPPMLDAYTAVVGYRVGGRRQKMSIQCWSITPTMLQQTTEIERMLNKVRLEGAIESLRWKQSDLMLYLARGLNRFNTYGTVYTNFNGLQMMGTLQYWHTVCAMYEALQAQLKGEGDMNFNFSGQQVTLDVDRTQALEGMLSRIEGQIGNELGNVKKLLAVYGVTGGDGSQGASNLAPTHAGQARLVLSQGQMTQVNRPRPWWWSYGFYW